MEKRGDIKPEYTPPEAVACKKRVEELKQRLLPFADKTAKDNTAAAQINELDSDFRKTAANQTAAALK